MYAFARYVRHSKTAGGDWFALDAREGIGRLLRSVRRDPARRDEPGQCARDAALSAVVNAERPPRLDDVKGKQYQSSAADWAMTPWHELQFSIPQPQYYAYSYASEGAGSTAKATATARGDLDGDGVSSTYSITSRRTRSFARRSDRS